MKYWCWNFQTFCRSHLSFIDFRRKILLEMYLSSWYLAQKKIWNNETIINFVAVTRMVNICPKLVNCNLSPGRLIISSYLNHVAFQKCKSPIYIMNLSRWNFLFIIHSCKWNNMKLLWIVFSVGFCYWFNHRENLFQENFKW